MYLEAPAAKEWSNEGSGNGMLESNIGRDKNGNAGNISGGQEHGQKEHLKLGVCILCRPHNKQKRLLRN